MPLDQYKLGDYLPLEEEIDYLKNIRGVRPKRSQMTEDELRVAGFIAWCTKCNHTHEKVFTAGGRSRLGRCFTCNCRNKVPAGHRR